MTSHHGTGGDPAGSGGSCPDTARDCPWRRPAPLVPTAISARCVPIHGMKAVPGSVACTIHRLVYGGRNRSVRSRLAAAISVIPASASSLGNRACRVRKARSDRPRASGEYVGMSVTPTAATRGGPASAGSCPHGRLPRRCARRGAPIRRARTEEPLRLHARPESLQAAQRPFVHHKKAESISLVASSRVTITSH